MRDFRTLKPGDKVTRLITSEQIPHEVEVESVTEDLITMVGGWTFDPATGIEIDEELGFGKCADGSYYTGSILSRGDPDESSQMPQL